MTTTASPAPSTPRPHRVAVIFGGRSTEHAISCVTAGSVIDALTSAGYDVVPIGIARDGRWVLESRDPAALRISEQGALPEVTTDGTGLVLAPGGNLVALDAGDLPAELSEVDVVFPVLHGPWGEDGTIQGLLELADVRYVGSGVLASAVGMDKHAMKLHLMAQGLPVLPYAVITERTWETDRAAAREAVASLGFPVFVKPARGGSSIGISKVGSLEELDEAVELARQHDPKVLVEAAAVDARELECGVLGGFGHDAPEASVVAEIVVEGDHEFYDFAAKYLPDEGSRLDVPADLPDDVAQEARELAVRAFDAMECEGLARVDFFWLPDGRLVINEINTMPGFTPSSMFPRMWAATGVDYPALVDRLVRLAAARSTGLR